VVVSLRPGLLLDRLAVPIVLAPLAGGPSTPELTAAVSNAGGFEFLAAGYLAAPTLAPRVIRRGSLGHRHSHGMHGEGGAMKGENQRW
jgi:NAD(P)H-dependent flavin oxidoreductase YrpB (nitropropane dioxygenase family)